jgi:hypothetical protein
VIAADIRKTFVAVAVACAVIVGSASSATPQPHISLVKVGDTFDVLGTSVKCAVGVGPSRKPTVTCALKRQGSSNPLPKSYAFSFGDRGVNVLGPGSQGRVVFRARSDSGVPLGNPAPIDRTLGRQNVHLHPVTQGLQGVNVSGSSVVCVAVGYPRPEQASLNCTLSSQAIAKALHKRRLDFRPLTVTLSPQTLRVWRMSKAKTQRVIFSRAQPTS